MYCILCGKDEFEVISNKVRDSVNYKIIKCKTCGHVQIDPIPDIDEDTDFYNTDSQSKELHSNMDLQQIKEKSTYDTSRRAQFVSDIATKDKKILEIGSGYGFFLEHMVNNGYYVEAIELSEDRRELSKAYCNCNIYSYNIMVDNIPEELYENYDIIVMFHVLEHITKPEVFLRQASKMLKKGGKFIIEVPNLDDHMLGISNEYTEFFWQRAHVSYYSFEALNRLLVKSDFKNINIMGIQRYSVYNAMNWFINRKPQIESPQFKTLNTLNWLEDYYKGYLESNKISDTLIAVVEK